MIDELPMLAEQRQARAAWEQQPERPPTAPPSRKEWRRMKRILHRAALAENKRRRKPWPICTECKSPIHPKERGYVFSDQCATCEVNHLFKLLWRSIRRRGRSKTRRALRRLAK
jgi:hypothetical protein